MFNPTTDGCVPGVISVPILGGPIFGGDATGTHAAPAVSDPGTMTLTR